MVAGVATAGGTGTIAFVSDRDGGEDGTDDGDTPLAQLPGPIITNPGDLLISDTQGILWTFDVETRQLTEHGLPFDGNFGIQYSGPQRIVIACFNCAKMYEIVPKPGE